MSRTPNSSPTHRSGHAIPLHPSRRGALSFGLSAAAGGLLPGPAHSEPLVVLPKRPSEFRVFAELPIVRPEHVPRDEGMLFFVQHSINANVIVYGAHRTAVGELDRYAPIEVYWRRYQTSGHRRELNFFERNFAFGVTAVADGKGKWTVGLVSWSERKGRLDIGPDGKLRLLVDVDGRPMRPVYVYAEAIADGFIPTIRHVDLYAVAEGEKGYVRERVVFD